MKNLFIFILTVLFFSCASFDVDTSIREKNVSQASSGVGKTPKTKKNQEQQQLSDDDPPQEVITVVVEKPVFIPEKDPTRPAKPVTIDSARDSVAAGVSKPADFSHAALVYDYNKDWVYEAYAMPLRVCDIRLEPGERALEAPFVSDSERWKIGAGVSMENGFSVQHVYVKPDAANQEASLIINTDRRVYHLILRSYNSVHTPIVRWRYHPGLPENYISPPSPNVTPNSQGVPGKEVSGSDAAFTGVDPRFLSFNYRVNYAVFNKPSWLPELVFDDGSKTYVTFPDGVLQREMPSVFENRRDLLNYRVMGKLIVIDKLIEKITVKIGKKEIEILKKRG